MRPCQFTISGKTKHPKITNLNVTENILPVKCSIHSDHINLLNAQYGCSALRKS